MGPMRYIALSGQVIIQRNGGSVKWSLNIPELIQYFEFEIGKNEIIFKYNQKQNDNSEGLISVKNGL